jgi:glutamate:GABA antiporter
MKKKIKLLQITLLSISAILNLKSLPMFAEMGSSIIFFLGIATMFFFIPISLIIAELSSAWPEEGGLYLWIKKAYGERIAFFAMWAYWMESIIWFPTMLIFIMAILLNILSKYFPGLETNNMFFILGIIFVFWILTILNFYGIKISANFSIFGVLFGTIVPFLLIIIFSIIWIIKGHDFNINFDLHSIIPKINLNNCMFFAGILLGMSGIEIIAFYSNDIEKPDINLPKSIIMSAIFILVIYAAGSLSISLVVPKSEISLASGVIQAIKIFFDKFNISFIMPFFTVLLLLGSLSGMNTWIIGPAKGLLIAAKDDLLPKFLTKENINGIPINLLIIQAFVGSFLSILFFIYIKNINGLVWIFVCLSFQFASILYILVFFSIIKLRHKYPNIKRPFKVPFVKLFSYIGIAMCIFTFFISYIVPEDIDISNKYIYLLLLLLSFLILNIPPFFLIKKNHT